MDITHLRIENFLTLGTADLELDGRGLLLIQGKNNDDSSASSNGSGKSSIVDAICWALYGTTARGESGDDIVNEKAKKDCMVAVDLDDAGQKYRVERYRKHSKFKDALRVWQVTSTGTLDPIDKGTTKETQEVLCKVMGCSLDVFVGSIYAGQEQMPDLPGMTDKQLKLLVEEAAGVEELAEAYALASKDATAADKACAVAATEGMNLAAQAGVASTEQTEAQDQEALFESGRKGRARDELTRVPPLQVQLTDLATKIGLFDEARLTGRKTVIEAQLAGLQGEQDKLERLQRELGIAQRNETLERSSLARAKKAMEDAKSDLTNVEAKVGTPCGECGKAYCEHDVEAVKEMRQRDVLRLVGEATAQVLLTRAAVATVVKTQKALDDHKATMTDVSAVSAELKAINEQLHDLSELRHQHTQYQKDIEDIKTLARTKLTEPNPWTPHVASRRKKWEDLIERAKKAADKADEMAAQRDLLRDACAVLGPAGVRAHILDSVTPFLNAQTSEYLGTLADGNIHAVWSTLGTTAKGELREKFNIAVKNDKGGKSFGLQSGGEKRKVRLATALALQDMVAARATKPINLFMADEIDDALDTPGLERLMTVLEKKAKERGTVMVISHNPLKDWIDNVIDVEKTGGRSVVSGSNVRTF